MAKSPVFKHLTKAIKSALVRERAERDADHGRRDALKTLAAGAGAIAGAAVPFPARALARSVWAASNTPVVVIGAGLAGLTAAYSLVKRGIPCELYEGTPRPGGRVFTFPKFNEEGMSCELGGEFIDSDHHEIQRLARELGLELVDFRKHDHGLKRHQYYVKGAHHYDEDLARAALPLARRLSADAKAIYSPGGKPPNYKSHTPAAARFDKLSIAEYLDAATDVDPWVLAAVRYAYLTEYGGELEDQSALNLITMLDGPPGPNYDIYPGDESRHIVGGNSRLPEALEKFLKPRAKLSYNRRLVKIADSGGSFTLTFEGAGPTLEVKARQVICAIPFSTLRKVEGLDTLGLSPVKLKMIREMGYGTNARYIYGFRERYWRKPHGGLPATTGYTFTDLKLQTYYDQSRDQKGKSGIICHFPGGKAGREEMPNRLEATLSELDLIHPGVKPLFDGKQMSWQWYSYPFALGSYTCLSPGQWTSFFGAGSEPELGGRLIFAGEHTNERSQGYMNGAVASGFDAAHQTLDSRVKA